MWELSHFQNKTITLQLHILAPVTLSDSIVLERGSSHKLQPFIACPKVELWIIKKIKLRKLGCSLLRISQLRYGPTQFNLVLSCGSFGSAL